MSFDEGRMVLDSRSNVSKEATVVVDDEGAVALCPKEPVVVLSRVVITKVHGIC